MTVSVLITQKKTKPCANGMVEGGRRSRAKGNRMKPRVKDRGKSEKLDGEDLYKHARKKKNRKAKRKVLSAEEP